jgi:hypothetical protein
MANSRITSRLDWCHAAIFKYESIRLGRFNLHYVLIMYATTIRLQFYCQPRYLEDPGQRVEGIKAAIPFLSSTHNVQKGIPISRYYCLHSIVAVSSESSLDSQPSSFRLSGLKFCIKPPTTASETKSKMTSRVNTSIGYQRLICVLTHLESCCVGLSGSCMCPADHRPDSND